VYVFGGSVRKLSNTLIETHTGGGRRVPARSPHGPKQSPNPCENWHPHGPQGRYRGTGSYPVCSRGESRSRFRRLMRRVEMNGVVQPGTSDFAMTRMAKGTSDHIEVDLKVLLDAAATESNMMSITWTFLTVALLRLPPTPYLPSVLWPVCIEFTYQNTFRK